MLKTGTNILLSQQDKQYRIVLEVFEYVWRDARFLKNKI